MIMMVTLPQLAEVEEDLVFLFENQCLDGIAAIIAERRRQIEKGYDSLHDDRHGVRELARMSSLRALDGSRVRDYGTTGNTTEDLRAAGALAAAALDKLARARRISVSRQAETVKET
jgi:hypothetical protein